MGIFDSELTMESIPRIFDSGLITKFDGRDFQIWKCRVSALLKSEGLWDFVVGEVKPPCEAGASRRDGHELGGGVDTEGESFAPPISEEAAEYAEAKVYYLLRHGLKGEPAGLVRTAKTAKEIWDRLLDVYESRSLWNRISLRKKLFNVCMADGEPILNYIGRVLSIVHELAAVGSPVSEQEKVCVLLNGLSDSFQLVGKCLQWSEKPTDFEFATKRLMDHETLRSIWESRDDAEQGGQERKGCSLQNGAHAGRNRPTRATRRRHANRCVKNVGDQEEEDDESGRTDECVFSVVNVKHLEPGDWFVATAATCHMTSRKDWFSAYNPLACPRNVRMLDNRVEKGIAVGDINVVLPEGKRAVITKVLHVPGLKMNLLSVGQLTTAGYSVSFGNGACTIIKKNGRVLTTGIKEMGIYKLKGLNRADDESIVET